MTAKPLTEEQDEMVKLAEAARDGHRLSRHGSRDLARAYLALIAAQAELTGAEPSDAEALKRESDAWMETARQAHVNEAFWRDLVHQTGRILGGRVYVQDDGGIVDEPLALRVPEVAAEMMQRLTTTHADPSPAEQRTSGALCNVSVSDGAAAPVPGHQIVAWQYELATTLNMDDGQYDGWQPRLTTSKPNVPKGSVRNLTPLVALSSPTQPDAPAPMSENT